MESFSEYYNRRNRPGSYKTKKARFISYWRGLKPNTPIYMDPIPKDHVGDNHNQDTIRITGRPAFVSSVIARLKDIILYDSQHSRLELSYKRIQRPREDGTWSYALYIRAKQR